MGAQNSEQFCQDHFMLFGCLLNRGKLASQRSWDANWGSPSLSSPPFSSSILPKTSMIDTIAPGQAQRQPVRAWVQLPMQLTRLSVRQHSHTYTRTYIRVFDDIYNNVLSTIENIHFAALISGHGSSPQPYIYWSTYCLPIYLPPLFGWRWRWLRPRRRRRYHWKSGCPGRLGGCVVLICDGRFRVGK